MYKKEVLDKVLELIEKDDAKGLKKMLDNGLEVNIYDDYGRIPIKKAFLKRANKCIDLLLSRGADINFFIPKYGFPLLSDLCNEKPQYMDMIKKAIKNGVYINHKDEFSRNCLFFLVDGGNISEQERLNLQKLLVVLGCDINNTLFKTLTNNRVNLTYYVATKGHVELLKHLISNGSSVNGKYNNDTLAGNPLITVANNRLLYPLPNEKKDKIVSLLLSSPQICLKKYNKTIQIQKPLKIPPLKIYFF